MLGINIGIDLDQSVRTVTEYALPSWITYKDNYQQTYGVNATGIYVTNGGFIFNNYIFLSDFSIPADKTVTVIFSFIWNFSDNYFTGSNQNVCLYLPDYYGDNVTYTPWGSTQQLLVRYDFENVYLQNNSTISKPITMVDGITYTAELIYNPTTKEALFKTYEGTSATGTPVVTIETVPSPFPTDTGYVNIVGNIGNYVGMAFAAIKADGSIFTWGDTTTGNFNSPTTAGFVSITASDFGFAGLKNDTSIFTWGNTAYFYNAPTDNGYSLIVAGATTFAALKNPGIGGSIAAWGSFSDAPTDTGYIAVIGYPHEAALAAIQIHNDGDVMGSIVQWGDEAFTNTYPVPTDTNFVALFANRNAFTGLTANGEVKSWGAFTRSNRSSVGPPADTNFVSVVGSFANAFAALTSSGGIRSWGFKSEGGTGAPGDTGYVEIVASGGSFAARKSDGSITVWGFASAGGTGGPTGTGYSQIAATVAAFSALNAGGSIYCWGDFDFGNSNVPTDADYTTVIANDSAFAALKSDGSVVSWGNTAGGGTGAPTDTGYVSIFPGNRGFAALKADGSITSWGNFTNLGGVSLDAGYAYKIAFDADQSDPEKLSYFTKMQITADSVIHKFP